MRLTSKTQSKVAAPLTRTLIVLQGTLKAEMSFNAVFRRDSFNVVKVNAIGNLDCVCGKLQIKLLKNILKNFCNLFFATDQVASFVSFTFSYFHTVTVRLLRIYE